MKRFIQNQSNIDESLIEYETVILFTAGHSSWKTIKEYSEAERHFTNNVYVNTVVAMYNNQTSTLIEKELSDFRLLYGLTNPDLQMSAVITMKFTNKADAVLMKLMKE